MDDGKEIVTLIVLVIFFKLSYFGLIETQKRCGSGFKQERTKYRWVKKWDKWEDQTDLLKNLKICRKK